MSSHVFIFTSLTANEMEQLFTSIGCLWYPYGKFLLLLLTHFSIG